MKFLRDENFPKTAVAFLERAGHEAFDFRLSTHRGLK